MTAVVDVIVKNNACVHITHCLCLNLSLSHTHTQLLTVALQDLPPHFGHGVSLRAIPHQSDHLLVYTTPRIAAITPVKLCFLAQACKFKIVCKMMQTLTFVLRQQGTQLGGLD